MTAGHATEGPATHERSDEPRLAPESMLTLTVNGRVEQVRARPHHTLVEVLRSELRLMSVREACGIGMCGACTILLDGRAVSGCLILAQLAEGHEILTVEGLRDSEGTMDPIQQAFIEHTAFQCSYCTPGFVMAARALLDERPDVDDDEILEALSGNLCRCGSYSMIRSAVADARDRLRGSEAPLRADTYSDAS